MTPRLQNICLQFLYILPALFHCFQTVVLLIRVFMVEIVTSVLGNNTVHVLLDLMETDAKLVIYKIIVKNSNRYLTISMN